MQSLTFFKNNCSMFRSCMGPAILWQTTSGNARRGILWGARGFCDMSLLAYEDIERRDDVCMQK